MKTVAQVAQMKGVSEETVRRAIRAGSLHATDIGGMYSISDEDAAAYCGAGRKKKGDVLRERWRRINK